MTDIESTHDEEQKLIRAVVQDPNADEPRKDYAVWLRNHGRKDRARIIEVQCEIESLQHEEKELLDRHRYEWGKALIGQGADYWNFHRGFPEEIQISSHHFLDSHAKINEITPVRHLTLGWLDDADLTKLSNLPICNQLLSLKIGTPYGHHREDIFGKKGLEAFAQSERFQGLRKLILRSDKIGDAGAHLIANSPSLTNLTHLQLVDPYFNQLGNESLHNTLKTLAEAPTLSHLERLEVGKDELESGKFSNFALTAADLKSRRNSQLSQRQ